MLLIRNCIRGNQKQLWKGQPNISKWQQSLFRQFRSYAIKHYKYTASTCYIRNFSTDHGNPAEVRLRQSHSSYFTALSDVPCCQEDPKDTDMITKFSENQKTKPLRTFGNKLEKNYSKADRNGMFNFKNCLYRRGSKKRNNSDVFKNLSRN